MTAVIMVGIGSAPPAAATFSGADGAVVFTRGSDVWTASFAGSYTEHRLTTDGLDQNPRWSGDGTRIAFNTRYDNVGTTSATGTDRQMLTHIGRDSEPAWSGVGSGDLRLVFVRVPVGKPGDLWGVRASGGRPWRMTWDGVRACGDAHPSWSPTARLITYVHHGTGPDSTCGTTDDTTHVMVLNLATRSRRTVPLNFDGTAWTVGGAPDFTADGGGVQYLAFATCVESVAEYNVATGRESAASFDESCEGGPQWHETVPTPSGGLGLLFSEPSGDDGLGFFCLSVPAGEHCVRGGVNLWSGIDVQPIH